MQAPYFDYTRQDEIIAKNNLQKIISDPKGFGDTNAGWCYLLAPLRTFLTDPRFISLIRQYKQKYYKNNEIQNKDFICAMYGKQNIQELSRDRNIMENINFQKRGDKKNYDIDTYTSADVYDTLKAICELTDNNGEMKYEYANKYFYFSQNGKKYQVRSPYIGFIKLVHLLRPDGSYRDVSTMSNILAELTAIMSESDNVLALNNNQYEKNNIIIIGKKTNYNNYNIRTTTTIFDNYNDIDLYEVENKLNEGTCITASSYDNHFFNIYKKDGYYYITGGGQIDSKKSLKRFSSLKNALMEWALPIDEFNYNVFGITKPIQNNNSITEYFAFQCFVNQESKINQIGMTDGDYKQLRIQQYNRQKVNKLKYRTQIIDIINNCTNILQLYDNNIRNMQEQLYNNMNSYNEKIEKFNNLNRNNLLSNRNINYNNHNYYNYYNNYNNNFNFYNNNYKKIRLIEQQKNILEREINILVSNIQQLNEQIEELNNNKKSIFDKQKKQMQKIWQDSNYDEEIFNLYTNFTNHVNRRNQII